ncbi:MAG: flagellar protein FlgN [Lachnospiraceae bacterium]|nr:flagellar protein FlgN [Lachnospiraceae bacterium]
MENLIEVLNGECSEYEGLLKLSQEKTAYIVKGDLENIQRITDEEQEWLGRLNRLEKKRVEVTKDIANVLNKDVTTLKLTSLIQMLSARPAEQKQLSDAVADLQTVVHKMQEVNERNRELIQHSLELVEFDLNLLQSMKTAPQTANYNKGAYNTDNTMGSAYHGFDAKQ